MNNDRNETLKYFNRSKEAWAKIPRLTIAKSGHASNMMDLRHHFEDGSEEAKFIDGLSRGEIKFQQHAVCKGSLKVRVYYSVSDNQIEVCQSDYGRDLGRILQGLYSNGTDSMTDYFERGRAVITKNNPLYKKVLKVAMKEEGKRKARYEEKRKQFDISFKMTHGHTFTEHLARI